MAPLPQSRQWLLLAALWLLLGGIGGWNLHVDRNTIDTYERERLSNIAKVIDENLGLQLLAANDALNSLRADLPYLRNRKDGNELLDRQLKNMSDAMPGVRTLLILDAEGNAVASDREALIGSNFRAREYFQFARKSGDPAMLHVSAPFRGNLGLFVVSLVKVIQDGQGKFDGIITATLDPDFFKTLLDSVLYAPDMVTSLAHADGTVFLAVPSRPGTDKGDLADLGAYFARHRDSGQKLTVVTGGFHATGEDRLMVMRSVIVPKTGMDQPLLVAVTRDMPSIFSTWHRNALEQGGLFALFVLATAAGLALYQRRQRAYEVLAAGQEAERRRMESELRESEASFRKLFEDSSDAILLIDGTGVFVECNQAALDMLKMTRRQFLRLPLERISPEFQPDGRRSSESAPEMIAQACGKGLHRFDWTCVGAEGAEFVVEVSLMPIVVRGQAMLHCTWRDITERKAAADRIEHLAFYDPLTDLPNRRLLLDRLQQALTSSARHQRYGALMLLDIDDFKTLNDTLGHDVGDRFLVAVASRLQACVREGDTVARHGGDEFVVILEDLNEDTLAAMQAEGVAEKILHAVSLPYLLDLTILDGVQHKRSYRCTSSIGITLFRDSSLSVDELLKRADTAMYQAKDAGRNSLRFFDPEMQAVVTARAALDNDLREAVQEGQFSLYYQPQVDGAGDRTGAEALLRWRHPGRGMVSPAEFIPLAEATGLIMPIGRWVLATACSQLAAWAALPEMAHLTMAVNVSARQFRHEDFVDQVLAIIDSTGADPQRLKLELTESLLLDDVEAVIAKMFALQSRGIGFSLDDFGTGYSSLSSLKRLPLVQLKIDQSFVRGVLKDHNDAAIARTIVALARSMGLAVIAEGVETEAQREFLAANGCDAYQGYLFGRPMPIEEFSRWQRSTGKGT